MCLERCVIQEPSSSRLEEHTAGVRAVNRRVTKRTGLILDSLVVERGNGRRTRVDGKRMAFQAEQVDLTALEEPRI